jgi:hypothetical protein
MNNLPTTYLSDSPFGTKIKSEDNRPWQGTSYPTRVI